MHWRALIVAFGLLAPVEAFASACSAAKTQLARLDAPGGRYAAAIRQQRAQMTKTRRMMTQHGCPRSSRPACRTLSSAYARMRRNLASLKRGGTSATRRRRARAKVRRACREFKPNRARIAKALGGKSGGSKVREQVRRARRVRKASAAEVAAVETGQSQLTYRARFARGTYRTMCVRTCDGFAFPASLSTTPGRFHLDAARCGAMCPGRELRLFASKARSATVAKARDVQTGQPYSTLPFAFRYRKNYDAACGCDFKPVAVEAGRLTGGPLVAQGSGKASRVPTWRPAFPPVAPPPVAAQLATPAAAPPAPRTADGVRIVGETYFPN